MACFLVEFELFQIMHRWQCRKFRTSQKPRLFIKLDRTRGLQFQRSNDPPGKSHVTKCDTLCGILGCTQIFITYKPALETIRQFQNGT